MTKFLLMGLPSTGKTTTLSTCVALLRKKGIAANLILTDTLINERIKHDDPVIQQYEKDHDVKILPGIFTAESPSKAFIKTYGEAAMCHLEERLLIDMIASSKENDWFDFGGRALLLPGVIEAVKAKKIIPVFLYAEHETILKRLPENDGIRKRPTYALAAEQSPDGTGWIRNAELHREQRLEAFTKNATIIVSVEKNPTDLLEEKFPTLYKSPEEIVREIFMRIRELEQIQNWDKNNFFERKLQFKEKKEWLEKNLNLKKRI